ncbi:MAG: leucine-rich repeat protein [Clostridia bacterium]|nr:leucine-rich repeat protein [Clostridia bacterium]
MDIDGSYYCSRCLRAIEAEGVCPHCGYDHRQQTNEPPALGMGVLLKGRYQLGCVIGCGGFGLTYAAWDETLQLPVAIKEYFPGDYAARENEYTDAVIVPEARRREYMIGLNQFLREARVLAMLKSTPGAVSVQDYFEENDTAYIVMEYLRGVTLDDYARENAISPRKLFVMMRPVVDALAELHSRGVMHRDVSPMNIMVLEDGSAKLIDFGSAGQMDRQQVIAFATDCYAPIEQYEPGGEGQGAWSDVYGVCAAMYRVLTGENPQPALLRAQRDELRSMRACGVRLKSHQTRALMRGLAVRPENRTQSIAELRAELYNLATPEELLRRRRLMRRMMSAAAVLLAAVLLAACNFAVGFPVGGGLRAALSPEGLIVKRSDPSAELLVIPERIWGLPVCAIGSEAFAGNDALRRVDIPGSVRDIGYMAFAECSALERVTARAGLETIGALAFYACPSLHTVELPDTVNTISETALGGCAQELTVWGARGGAVHETAQAAGWTFADRREYDAEPMGDGVRIISCRSEDPGLVLPSYIDGLPVRGLREDSGDDLLYSIHVESVVYPGTIETLNKQYGGKEIESIVVREGTRVIGENTFEMMAGDTFDGLAVQLPAGLEAIGDRAFMLSGVRELQLPDTLRAIGESAFFCSDIQSVVLPESLKEIGMNAFSFSELKSVVLSPSVPSVPMSAFSYCYHLASVTIPEGVLEIGECAFESCTGLELIDLPDGCERIGKGAFAQCSELKYIFIPVSVKEIDDSAFDGRSAHLVIAGEGGSEAERYARAKGIIFEDVNVCNANDPYQDVYTGSSLPADADELICMSYNRDDGMLITKLYGVEGAAWRRVVLPSQLEDIHAQAFRLNENLSEIRLPGSLRVIGEKAFAGCCSLRALEFPIGLAEIGAEAFWESGLREVVLPDTVTSIGREAFADCSSLERVKLPGGATMLTDLVFAKSALRSVEVPGNIRTVGNAFYGCEQLEEIVFEEGVMRLETSLQHCTSLRSVVIPASMEYITRGALRGCTALEDIYIYAENVDMEYAMYAYATSALVGAGMVRTENGSDEPHLLADCPDVTIHGLPGSTAQAYAEKYGIAFELLKP